MNSRLFLVVLLCAVLSFSSALAEDQIILGCVPAMIQLPPGYFQFGKSVPGHPREYISKDYKTFIQCESVTENYSDDAFPLYKNDAGLIELLLQYKSKYEEIGYAVDFSFSDECASLIAYNGVFANLFIFHQYGIARIMIWGENQLDVLFEIGIRAEDYRETK